MPGDNLAPYPDINFVPTQLIKRVDILTGGASSVYGADAVGGVINFIMDNTFTGLRLDAQASVFQHDNRAGGDILNANQLSGYHPPHGLSTNGGAGDIAAVMGAAFDDGRGHAQAYATYRRQRPVLTIDRATIPSARCQRNAHDRRRRDRIASVAAARSPTIAHASLLCQLILFCGTNHYAGSGLHALNFAPYNYYQRPDERYTFGAFADYEISPARSRTSKRCSWTTLPCGDCSVRCVLRKSDDHQLRQRALSAQQKAVLCAPNNLIVGRFVDPVLETRSISRGCLLPDATSKAAAGTISGTRTIALLAASAAICSRASPMMPSYQYGHVSSARCAHKRLFRFTVWLQRALT